VVQPVLHGLTSEFAHGRAFSEVVPVANPAAGGGFTYTVGGNYWERLAALAFTLVTDGNAATRQVLVEFQDGSGTGIASTAGGGTQILSLTRKYSFTPNQSAASGLVGTSLLAPLPTLFLQPGFKVVVSIANVQAGDQLSAIRVYREAFDTGPEGYPVGMVEENMYVGEFERLGN
jgi:hypothetical protein